MSGLLWPGSEPRYFFGRFFCCSRSFICSNNKLLWKGFGHRNYSTYFITSDNVFAKHNFLPLARPYGVSDCTQRHFRMLLTPDEGKQPSVVLFWPYMMLGFCEILRFQKVIFHSICLRWPNFNELPSISGKTQTFSFASVAKTSSRLFWWLLNVFSVIRSWCFSINLDRNSYFFHTFFRLLWTFFIVGGSHCYKKTFITCAVGCLNEWFEATLRL